MEDRIYIKTGRPEFDSLYPMIKSFLQKNIMDVVIDDDKIRGYKTPDAKSIWIRDNADMFRGFKYFENDLKSMINHFAETQADNGRIFDYFTIFPEKLPSERENWTKYVRVPVEADVEFRFIKAIFLAWQASGDDLWLENLLPKMEKALQYILNHKWRWDEKEGLVKRAYTIDTWDFAYSAGEHEWLQFQINDDTFWGYMHGDNSGYYEAFKIMALIYNYFNKEDISKVWENRAKHLKDSINRVCWNGSFYTHFVKITPVQIPGVDESKQLSLSNPMDINRGVTTQPMAASIIKEYIKRREETDAFAEWFSIEPPFPDGIFGDEKLIGGAYVNGGIMPLVGGELAKAALDNGFEEYGVDILKRYYSMISEKNETFLWYFPDGTPASIETSTSPLAEPTDGWGSSAMLYAFIEGLAGIEDRLKKYQKVKLSPRWYAADVCEANVQVGYEASDVFFSYIYKQNENSVSIEIKSRETDLECHILIPQGVMTKSVKVDNKEVDFRNNNVEKSAYVDFDCKIEGSTSIIINLNKA